jgi:hypothetical protein
MEAFVKSLFIFLLVFSLSHPAFAATPAKEESKEAPKAAKVKEDKTKGEKPSEDSSGKGVEFSKVNTKVSEALCQKMQQCASAQKMSPGQCLSEVKSAFQESYDSLPKEKRFEVGVPDLDLCVKSIQASSCDELKAAPSLKGCDFIQQLPPAPPAS